MPMGPSGGGGGGKFHSHFQQQQHRQRDNEGEGEVKKIYLLQPMPKVVPQPQLKGGGFMGPVQTHIHMQPVQQQTKTPTRHSSKDYGTETGGEEISASAGAKTGKGSHSSDIKILPIVIIPPIAPMPPIQLPPNNNVHTPRMTLTPQFNNYVVSTKDDRKSPYTAAHIATMLQDHKSFSDYGGSGEASVYRGSASRNRYRPNRISRPSDYSQAATRFRTSRIHDDYADDYDYPASTIWRQSRRWTPSSSRRRSYLDQADSWRPAKPPRDSIRDILDQQISFDDDLSIDSNEYREATRNVRTDCCNDIRRPRLQLSSSSNVDTLDNYMANSNQEQRDVAFNNYDEPKSSASTTNNSKWSLDSPSDIDETIVNRDRDNPTSLHKNSDLSSVYYDRDFQIDQSQASSNQKLSHSSDGHKSNRLKLDAREFLDDDEWRFDSVKSVTHTNPNANATKYTATNTSQTLAITLNSTSVI